VQRLKRNSIILFTVVFMAAAMFSLSATAEVDVGEVRTNSGGIQTVKSEEASKIIQDDIRVNDLDVSPINTQKVKKDIMPDTKKEGKKVLNYFLRVMGAVLACAAFIFIILVFVKKFYGSAFAIDEADEYEDLSLLAPETKEEALKSFLSKTKF